MMAGRITTETVAAWNKTPLPRRSLRALRKRWKRDLARIEAAYPLEDWNRCDPASETIRNLATAVAEIDGLITCTRIGEPDPSPPHPQETINDHRRGK